MTDPASWPRVQELFAGEFGPVSRVTIAGGLAAGRIDNGMDRLVQSHRSESSNRNFFAQPKTPV